MGRAVYQTRWFRLASIALSFAGLTAALLAVRPYLGTLGAPQWLGPGLLDVVLWFAVAAAFAFGTAAVWARKASGAGRDAKGYPLWSRPLANAPDPWTDRLEHLREYLANEGGVFGPESPPAPPAPPRQSAP